MRQRGFVPQREQRDFIFTTCRIVMEGFFSCKYVLWTIKGRMRALIDYGIRRIRVLILGCKINVVAVRPRHKRSLEVRYRGRHNSVIPI